jgi:hypothetical protein
MCGNRQDNNFNWIILMSTLVILKQEVYMEGRLTIPLTPPMSNGLLPSLSTTRTATPVIISYRDKTRTLVYFLVSLTETRTCAI